MGGKIHFVLISPSFFAVRRAVANEEHLKILKQGVKIWNDWRLENPKIRPDLSHINLSGANLNFVNFSGSNLSFAKLNNAKLRSANLSSAQLSHADFNGAELRGAALIGSIIISANFSGADLIDANISHSRLTGSDLRQARLIGLNLSSTKLDSTRFDESQLLFATFSNVDLRKVRGLETVLYLGSSEIGINTIYLSEGKIPEIFLRGCGVPEVLIAQIPALIAARQPIQFYSCFISYSSKDQKFAQRLYADLQSRGVRSWYAPEDLKIGERVRVGIDESIRVHDKLLLLLSKNSIESEWVEKEVETAMERERKQKRTILFPIRLDDSVLKVESGWAADIRRSRNVGDFRQWKNHDTYSKAFDRLLRDLKAEA